MVDDALPKVPGYRFEAKMAEGGMGVVYRAVDDTLGRTVAIKMIRGALLGKGDEEEETVARFLREARAAAQIRSNHVAHVLQFGRTEAGDLFLVLEYLDGETLADVIRREKRIDVARAVRITRQICRGMEAAHTLGIVHRDLKPSNVMLVDQDGEHDFVKILDFGVAKVVGERESGVTRAGMLVGTYTCMAPEQVVNETIDARTDVYAVAVMLFRLLTGKPLFEGNDVTAVLYHHVHTPAPAPSRVAPDANIPAALDAIVLRCLEKQANRRVRSMADLDRALGVSLELGVDAERALEHAPTAIRTGVNDETRTSFASEGPASATARTEAEPEDGEVFAESGPMDAIDPLGKTQITKSGAVAPPLPDPPTPGTSTSSRAQEQLRARTGEPIPSRVDPTPPTRRPAALAALVGLLVVVAVIATLVWVTGGPDDEVVVTVQAAASVGAPAKAEPAESAPAEELPAPDTEAPPKVAVVDEPEAEPSPPAEEPRATPDHGDTAPPDATAANGSNAPAKRPTASSSSSSTASSEKARAEQKRKRALRKKAEDAKPSPKSTADAAADNDKKPKPRFIRVRTGDSDG